MAIMRLSIVTYRALHHGALTSAKGLDDLGFAARWRHQQGREMLRNYKVGTAILVGVLALGSLICLNQALASESVVVNGNTFVCQNSCVVSSNSNGQLSVRDSAYGWVSMIVKGPGSIRVP